MSREIYKELIDEIQTIGENTFFNCYDVIHLCVSYLFKGEIIKSLSLKLSRSLFIQAFYELLRFGNPRSISAFYNKFSKVNIDNLPYREDVIKNIMYCLGEECTLCTGCNDNSKSWTLIDKINVIHEMGFPVLAENTVDYDSVFSAICDLQESLKTKSWKESVTQLLKSTQYESLFKDLLPAFIQWGHEKIVSMIPQNTRINWTIENVIISGKIDIVKKYFEIDKKLDMEKLQSSFNGQLINYCCSTEKVNVLKMIVDKIPQFKTIIREQHIYHAAVFGDVEMMKYLIDIYISYRSTENTKDTIHIFNTELLPRLISYLIEVIENDEVQVVSFIIDENELKCRADIDYSYLLSTVSRTKAYNTGIYLLKNKMDCIDIKALLVFEKAIFFKNWVEMYPHIVACLKKKTGRIPHMISGEHVENIVLRGDNKMIQCLGNLGVIIDHDNKLVSNVFKSGDIDVFRYIIDFYEVRENLRLGKFGESSCQGISKFMEKYKDFLKEDMYMRALYLNDLLMIKRLFDLKITVSRNLIKSILSVERTGTTFISVVTSFMLENKYHDSDYKIIINCLLKRGEYEALAELFCYKNINPVLIDVLVVHREFLNFLFTNKRALPKLVKDIITKK